MTRTTWTNAHYVVAFGCAIAVYIGKRYLGYIRRNYKLPPGPPGLPWFGNVIGISATAPWLTYHEWAKAYGDLVYSRLLGKDIIIINSEKVANELLAKRSRNYSDRPYLITNELCGLGFNSVMLPYGSEWRLHRRYFYQTFRIDAASRFLPLQDRKSCQVLRQLFCTPEQLNDHIFEYTASVILNSVYDYDPESRNNELVDMAANVLKTVVVAITAEVAIVVAAFPMLLNLPSWFPGMSLKKKMEVARGYTKQYIEKPFALSLQQLPGTRVVPSMVHDALRNAEEKGVVADESWRKSLKEAAATAFLAASGPSDSALMTFFLMMMTNPEAQKNAQAQIDAVVGKSKLPTIDDRPSLPYVDAIQREILRYSPSLPLSVPHSTTADDIYGGYHIPKGAIVIANIWSMTHDESKYPNPHAFFPERFLNDDGTLKPEDVEDVVFGFGRRICAGRHFADTSVWNVIAKVLAVFTILKPLDEDGVEIPVEPKFSSGSTVHPLPFRCRIVPRREGMDAEKLEELILASSK